MEAGDPYDAVKNGRTRPEVRHHRSGSDHRQSASLLAPREARERGGSHSETKVRLMAREAHRFNKHGCNATEPSCLIEDGGIHNRRKSIDESGGRNNAAGTDAGRG